MDPRVEVDAIRRKKVQFIRKFRDPRFSCYNVHMPENTREQQQNAFRDKSSQEAKTT